MSTVFWQELAIAGETGFPYFTAVYVVGFVAAVGIGSLAWYNSKRPPGWEGQERPGFIPKVKGAEDEDNSEG
ncbi:MAG: hypothetical protein HC812_06075 [Leptolyngbya sp. RL_3_1]|nr:hypothetical protein [Leptolyngbya sp. RL_3_1]